MLFGQINSAAKLRPIMFRVVTCWEFYLGEGIKLISRNFRII